MKKESVGISNLLYTVHKKFHIARSIKATPKRAKVNVYKKF